MPLLKEDRHMWVLIEPDDAQSKCIESLTQGGGRPVRRIPESNQRCRSKETKVARGALDAVAVTRFLSRGLGAHAGT